MVVHCYSLKLITPQQPASGLPSIPQLLRACTLGVLHHSLHCVKVQNQIVRTHHCQALDAAHASLGRFLNTGLWSHLHVEQSQLQKAPVGLLQQRPLQ